MKYVKTLPLILALALSLNALMGCKNTPTQSQPSASSPPPSSPSSSSSSSRSSPSSSTSSSSSSSRGTPSASSSQSSGMPSMPSSSPPGNTMPSLPSANLPSASLPSRSSQPSSTANSDRKGAENTGDMDAADPGPENDDIDFSESDSSSRQSSNDGSTPPPSSSDATPADEPAISNEENVAVLDGELDEAMANYDGMILRERGYILNRGNQKGSEEEVEQAGGPEGGDVPYEEGDIDEPSGRGDGPATQREGSSGGSYKPNTQPGRGSGDKRHGNVPPPEDIPDGSDDDVVARQIREAAMQEQDPKLREKLWEEYRKYKNQTKGG